jgi:seryl-tRNA synthetase
MIGLTGKIITYQICWFFHHVLKKSNNFYYTTSKIMGMLHEMCQSIVKTSEEFYKSIGIPYQVVSIVFGALNSAALAKYDLYGYFPASNTFKELVSYSNVLITKLANK